MQNVRQRRLHQFPAGDALDGLRQGRRQPVELVLHQHPLKGLGWQADKRREGDVSRQTKARLNVSYGPERSDACGRDSGGSVQTSRGLEKRHYAYEFPKALAPGS